MSTFDVIVHSNVNIFEYFDLVKIPTEVTTRWRDRIVDHCILHGWDTPTMLPAAVSRRAGIMLADSGWVGTVNAAIRCMYDASRRASGANSTELTGADSCDIIRGWLMEELEKYTGEEHVAV